MKNKVLGVIVTACMLFGIFVPVTVSAQSGGGAYPSGSGAAGVLVNNTAVINPTDVIPGGQGVGFYSIMEEPALDIVGDGDVTLKSEEWLKYDVQALRAGTYTLSIDYAATGTYKNYVYFDFYADDTLTNRTKLSNTANLNTFTETDIYNVYIPEGTQSITLKNSSQAIAPPAEDFVGMPTVLLKTIKLEYVDSFDTSDIDITSGMAHNIINKISGDGYFDASDADSPDFNNNNVTGNNAAEKTTQLVMTAAGDRGTYDISALKPGTYSISLKAGTRVAAAVNVYIDDEKQIAAHDLEFNFDATNHIENRLGSIYIGSGAERLTIENAKGHIYASEFTLSYVSENKVIEGKTFAAITDPVAFRYANGRETLQTESGKYVVLYSGDSLTFDAAEFDGTYRVSAVWWLNSGQTFTAANISKNGAAAEYFAVGALGATGAAAETEIGYINLDGDAEQTITFSPVITGGAFRIEKLILERTEGFRPSKTINALNVVPGGQGVGYYDSGAAGTLQTESGTTVILYNTEWVKYDISGLSGMYKISALCSLTNGQTLNSAIFNIDGTEKTADIFAVQDGTMEIRELGVLNLGEAASQLQFGVNITGGAFRLKELILEPVTVESGVVFTDSLGDEIEEIGENSSVFAKVTLVNNTKKATRRALIIAVYEGGRLADADIYSTTVAADSVCEDIFEVPVGENQSVKAFIWDLDGNKLQLSPVCENNQIS